jgi:hypothetical protein
MGDLLTPVEDVNIGRALLDNVQGDICMIPIIWADNEKYVEHMVILGNIFIRDHYTVFDLENMQIGLGEPDVAFGNRYDIEEDTTVPEEEKEEGSSFTFNYVLLIVFVSIAILIGIGVFCHCKSKDDKEVVYDSGVQEERLVDNEQS